MPIATTTARMPQPALMPCPACGGLQCLCRPRFFAGQLLTEEDLNRLEHYIIEKNKLHNRYLHGWGVVCGLEVFCHPSEGFVKVKSGYALSPCGDDIVVSRDEVVNVCDLIKKCRDDQQRQWDCEPAWPRQQLESDDQDTSWVLYLCYDEKSSRGVTALRGGGGAACCSRCNCGGSSNCGCGCHEKPNSQMKNSYRPVQPKTPPQCEPTITCEGYTFQLRKATAPPNTASRDFGRMINRIADCIKHLVKVTQALKSEELPLEERINTVKEEWLGLLDQHGIHNCDLYQRILQLSPEDTIDNLLLETVQECVCSALLPPCPMPVEDNCVPIATIVVNHKDGCRVMRVCNWEHRRIVLTSPGLEYWIEAYQNGLAESIAEFCCTPPDPRASNPFRTLLEGALDASDDEEGENLLISTLLGEIFIKPLAKLRNKKNS